MIVRCSWLLRLKARIAGLPPGEVVLTTVGPIIVRGDIDPEPEMLMHERIHLRQWQELLGVGYVVIFWVLWFRSWHRTGHRVLAYDAHPMELEAYAGQDDPGYLDTRRRWAWLEYL